MPEKTFPLACSGHRISPRPDYRACGLSAAIRHAKRSPCPCRKAQPEQSQLGRLTNMPTGKVEARILCNIKALQTWIHFK